jgi:hypothetical protein
MVAVLQGEGHDAIGQRCDVTSLADIADLAERAAGLSTCSFA